MSKKLSQQFSCSKMMLPEHRLDLERHSAYIMREEEMHRPLLDEQRREEMERLLQAAMAGGSALRFTILTDVGRSEFTGVPFSCDLTAGLIRISSSGQLLKIRANQVIALTEP